MSTSTASKTLTGTVKFFNSAKGYGFITGSDKKETFFHINDVCEGPDPKQDDHVEYEIGQGKKGECAKNVVLV